MGSHGPLQAPIFSGRFFLFCPIFYLFHGNSLYLRPCYLTPCEFDNLSALLTVPCCTIDHLHSSRP